MADPSETTQVSRVPAEPGSEELVDAVRSLASQVGDLQGEVQALRHESRVLPSDDGARPGWDEGTPAVRESPSWVRSVDTPRARSLSVPWLLVEILFLVGVAVLAAIADLEPAVIAAVMVAAWLLVAIAEWASAKAAARERTLLYDTTFVQSSVPDDPSWLASGGDTDLDLTADERVATRLPPPQPE